VGYNPVIPSRPPALKYTMEFPDPRRFNKIMARLNAGERP